jgi:F-type H+-transporting ATPase subunit a
MDLDKVLSPNTLFHIKIFGLSIPVTQSIVMMWVVMAIIILFALVFTRKLKTVPEGKQNVAEIVVETVNKMMKSNLGHHWKSFAPFFGTILLFLIFSNIAEIFNILPTGEQLYKITGIAFFERIPEFAIEPPTKDLNVTLTMAVIMIFLIPYSGIKYKGLKGFAKGFLKPTPIMLPFNILDYGTRTLSLSLRLFGNILAGYIIINMLYQGSLFLKPIIPLASMFFDLFDAGLQAYIFVFLSSLYISEAIE